MQFNIAYITVRRKYENKKIMQKLYTDFNLHIDGNTTEYVWNINLNLRKDEKYRINL